MRLTGHGTITDIAIVLGIMVGVGMVIAFIIRSIAYSEHATGVIAPWLDLEISDDYHLVMPTRYASN